MDFGPLFPEWSALLLGFICFSAVFALLAKVLLPRINKVLVEREEATSGLEDRADAIRAQAQETYEEYQRLLSEARHEAARIRQESTERGAALIAELRAEGQRQRDELVTAAHDRLAADRLLAETELRAEVNAISVELAGRVLGEPLEDFARERERRQG